MPTRAATAAPATSNGSANVEQLDEIRESLNRIEDVLNRGQHVLYDDEADGGEPADAGAVAASSAAAHGDSSHAYHSYHSTPLKRSVAEPVSPVHQRMPAAHPPIAPRRGAPAVEPQPVVSPYQAAHDAAHRRPSGSATRARTASGTHHSAGRRTSKAKSEEEELSASARARQIEEIKRTSGRVPNFEDGVDDNDTAQNTSIDELKERIRRELEEYHRNGPLMHRRASYQRKQRSATVPRTFAAARVSSTKPAAAAPATSSTVPPSPPPTRPAKASKVRTPKRVAPPPAAETRAGLSRSAAPAPVARSVPRKAATTSSTTKSRAKTVGPPASRSAHNATAAAPAAKPFWERLYRDAAAQQEKRDQRAEQRRIEMEAERAKSQPVRRVHRPPAHTTYSTYYRNLQSNGESAIQSREMSANRVRAGTSSSSNVPAQHTSYVPKRATAANEGSRAGATKPPAGGSSAGSAPAHVAARRPSAQPAARKPAASSTPPVPLPLGPGPRAAAPEAATAAPPKSAAQKPTEETELRVPPAAQEERATPLPDRSRDCSHEPFGDEAASRGQSEEADAYGAAAAGSTKHARARHSDSDSDSEPDEVPQKSTPHPYVAPLDLSGIKK